MVRGAAAKCSDLVSLSDHLGFAPQRIFYLVQKHNELYFEIEIPKRDPAAPRRKISIPRTELKGVQREILKKVGSEHSVHECAYAYVKGRSAISAARKLRGRHYVLRLDISDFFPSISERRIFGLFRYMGFNQKSSYILSRLTTYKGSLCQGAPTSPFLSNMVCVRMDTQFEKIAQSFGLNYLRYSDDLFFYGSSPFDHQKVVKISTKILRDHGFTINAKKTRFMPATSPRLTLGLMTHGKDIRIPRRQLRIYRAAFHKATNNLSWAENNMERLAGMAAYYKCIYGQDEQYKDYIRILTNVRRLKVHAARAAA